MGVCSGCGAEISGGRRLCSSCEEKLTQTAAAPASIASVSSSAFAQTRFLPGAVLAGRYRIVALLGKGGMGEVYRADDLTIGQQVALKFLPERIASHPAAVERFRNEVRIARQVSHPNVCRVYDVGEAEGQIFLSMEYVDGENLASLLRRIGRLPGDKALEIARGLCAGLAAAHAKGVLHRDLKPGNVMLDGRGQLLLTDFGLAGIAGAIAGTEVRDGTPAYMAPEQLAGEEVTVKSDLYSLGLVLYEIFTGKVPFQSDTLGGLLRARRETPPTSPSTVVRDLDPAVERVILRCLEPDPMRRPGSALSVAAALPGGDPLAAALAAGETPSPEMVAAAGEGAGLSPRVAVPVFAAILIGIAFSVVMGYSGSALEKIRPEYSPEVLNEKAREVIARAGYMGRGADSVSGFAWNHELVGYVQSHDKPKPAWDRVLTHPPSMLGFWYRQSEQPMTALQFHDDLLTPGIVRPEDPGPIETGMIAVRLDPKGRLTHFEAMPPQREKPSKEAAAPVDWKPLFAAAGLDPAQFQAAAPEWNWLEASDTRAAWTGKWPESGRELRVEAAAWRGKPVVFALIGPWTGTPRMPAANAQDREAPVFFVLGSLAIVIIFGGALLARKNLRAGRGDRPGAIRLAALMFAVQMSLWLARGHMTMSMGTFGMFLLAICTSVFYGAVVWTVYVALEPYARRHWPQTLIGWTTALTGKLREPVVGREALFGCALAVGWVLLDRVVSRWGPGGSPELFDPDLLLGTRSMLGLMLRNVPHGIRDALLFFFLIFVLRVLLRNQWLAAAGFALIFAAMSFVGNSNPWYAAAVSFVSLGMAAVVVLRFGLLALAVGIFLSGVLGNAPVTANTSAWYSANMAFIVAFTAAVAVWAFRAALGGRRVWKGDLFG